MPFSCMLCSATFHQERLLAMHIAASHPPSPVVAVASSTKRFRCRKCHERFASQTEFNLHLDVTNHRDTTQESQMTTNAPTSTNRSYSCQVCSETFTSQRQFNKHLQNSGHLCQKNETNRQEMSLSEDEIEKLKIRREVIQTLHAEGISSNRYRRPTGAIYLVCDLDTLLEPIVTRPQVLETLKPSNEQGIALVTREFTSVVTNDQTPTKQLAFYHSMKASDYHLSFKTNGWTVDRSVIPTCHQIELLLTKLVNEARDQQRKTLVLLPSEENQGIVSACRQLLRNPCWYVEIFAWSHLIDEHLVLLMNQYPHKMIVHLLDNYVDRIVCPERNFQVQLQVERIKSKLKEEKQDPEAAAYTCPLTMEILETPVVSSCCGQAFEEKAVNDHVAAKRTSQCPQCRCTCTFKKISSLSHMVEAFRKRHFAP